MRRHSCAGIWGCSMSRQALILRRRHTQQSGSLPTADVSPPHTEHFTVCLRRSGEIESFACSRISGGTTDSGFSCAFRFIRSPVHFTMAEMTPPNNYLSNSYRKVDTCLGRFGYLYYYGYIQRSAAALAALPGGDARIPSLQIDVRRHGVRADWTMGLALGVIFNECFHLSDPHFIRRKKYSTGCTKFVKILKGRCEESDVRKRVTVSGTANPESGRKGGNARLSGATLRSMTPSPAPKIQLVNTPDYRENYANSVQVRVNLWDFFLLFGRVNQTAPDNVALHNFQGIYVSPQQAKALLNVLQQNVTQYESAFGEIRLEPQTVGSTVQ